MKVAGHPVGPARGDCLITSGADMGGATCSAAKARSVRAPAGRGAGPQLGGPALCAKGSGDSDSSASLRCLGTSGGLVHVDGRPFKGDSESSAVGGPASKNRAWALRAAGRRANSCASLPQIKNPRPAARSLRAKALSARTVRRRFRPPGSALRAAPGGVGWGVGAADRSGCRGTWRGARARRPRRAPSRRASLCRAPPPLRPASRRTCARGTWS